MTVAKDTEPLHPLIATYLALESDTKKVISLLWETGKTYTAEELKESCGIDVEGNEALAKRLENNKKIKYAQNRFSYMTKYSDVRDRDQLLRLLQIFPGGIRVDDLIDAYPTATKDVEALRDEGEICLILNTDLQRTIAYPRYYYYHTDPRISVDDELKKLFRSIDVPTDDLSPVREEKSRLTPAKRKIMRIEEFNTLPDSTAKSSNPLSDPFYQNMRIKEEFNKLVRLSARAFYDDITSKVDKSPKPSRRIVDRGIAVVIFDGLTRRTWAREDEFAEFLTLHEKQLQRTLRFLEKQKLVIRATREEPAKMPKLYCPSAFVDVDALKTKAARKREKKIKLCIRTYWRLDYAQMLNAVMYRLQRMEEILEDEHQDIGDGDENASRGKLAEKMEVQLKPLRDQLSRVKDLEAPDSGNLEEWELRRQSNFRSGQQ